MEFHHVPRLQGIVFEKMMSRNFCKKNYLFPDVYVFFPFIEFKNKKISYTINNIYEMAQHRSNSYKVWNIIVI